MLHPDYADDDILICDPEGEFGALVKPWAGKRPRWPIWWRAAKTA